VTFIIHPKLTI